MLPSHSLDSAEAEAVAPAGARQPHTRKRGPKPGTEAAKRGGRATRDKRGTEHYRRIGAIGGATVLEKHGLEFYREIGRRGGETTRRTLGTEHFARIGRIGGRHKGEREGAILIHQSA
jgi:general stress protein YciG